jgi:hypothetical protein
MDIITNFAAGKEAVGAIFGSDQNKEKCKDKDPTSSNWGSKRNNNKKKKNQQGKQEAPTDDLCCRCGSQETLRTPRQGHFRQNA